MKRRSFLQSLLFGVSAMATGSMVFMGKSQSSAAQDLDVSKHKDNKFPYELSDDEWRARLSREEYRVLRKEGTEPPFSSPLNKEKRDGVYVCTACGHPLFLSQHKYESGTGWPSFWQPANEQAIGTSRDFKLFLPRTEIHCANCGGHLGHVFEDGPRPTGLRYCMNGVALAFEPTLEPSAAGE